MFGDSKLNLKIAMPSSHNTHDTVLVLESSIAMLQTLLREAKRIEENTKAEWEKTMRERPKRVSKQSKKTKLNIAIPDSPSDCEHKEPLTPRARDH